MGLYLYGCYGPSRVVDIRMPDYHTLKAAQYRYICKPYHWGDPGMVEVCRGGWAGRMTGMKVARIRKLWEDVERPRYLLHVSDSEMLKDEGMKRANTGTLHYCKGRTPVLWLEEFEGCVPMGQCHRQGKVWVFDGFGTGWSGDPVENAKQFEAKYLEVLTGR